MDQDHRSGGQFKRARDHLAGLDPHVGDRAMLQRLVGKQTTMIVQKQYTELFDPFA